MNEYLKRNAQKGIRQNTTPVQDKTTNGIPNSAMQDVLSGRAHATSQMMGHSQNLAPSIAAKMSRSFGMDLTGMQVYRSDAMVGSGMEGMASGNKVVLSSDVDLNTTAGQAVLGHEISHIRAQSQGIGMGNSGLYENAALEHQADTEGLLAAQGKSIYSDGGMDTGIGMQYGLGMQGVENVTPLSGGMSASAGAPMQAKKKKKPAAVQNAGFTAENNEDDDPDIVNMKGPEPQKFEELVNNTTGNADREINTKMDAYGGENEDKIMGMFGDILGAGEYKEKPKKTEMTENTDQQNAKPAEPENESREAKIKRIYKEKAAKWAEEGKFEIAEFGRRLRDYVLNQIGGENHGVTLTDEGIAKYAHYMDILESELTTHKTEEKNDEPAEKFFEKMYKWQNGKEEMAEKPRMVKRKANKKSNNDPEFEETQVTWDDYEKQLRKYNVDENEINRIHEKWIEQNPNVEYDVYKACKDKKEERKVHQNYKSAGQFQKMLKQDEKDKKKSEKTEGKEADQALIDEIKAAENKVKAYKKDQKSKGKLFDKQKSQEQKAEKRAKKEADKQFRASIKDNTIRNTLSAKVDQRFTTISRMSKASVFGGQNNAETEEKLLGSGLEVIGEENEDEIENEIENVVENVNENEIENLTDQQKEYLEQELPSDITNIHFKMVETKAEKKGLKPIEESVIDQINDYMDTDIDEEGAENADPKVGTLMQQRQKERWQLSKIVGKTGTEQDRIRLQTLEEDEAVRRLCAKSVVKQIKKIWEDQGHKLTDAQMNDYKESLKKVQKSSFEYDMNKPEEDQVGRESDVYKYYLTQHRQEELEKKKAIQEKAKYNEKAKEKRRTTFAESENFLAGGDAVNFMAREKENKKLQKEAIEAMSRGGNKDYSDVVLNSMEKDVAALKQKLKEQKKARKKK